MDSGVETLLEAEQYSLPHTDKDAVLLETINGLTAHHYAHSRDYRRIVDTAYAGAVNARSLSDVPYLPVSLFKKVDLKSVPDDEIYKVMHSSGTTSQEVSRVFLDVDTARLQTRALTSIMRHFLGPVRRPMIIIDHPDVLCDRKEFSARGAGIIGMMTYGRDHFYALDSEMTLDQSGLEVWVDDHRDDDLLLFGFTYMVWEYFYTPLRDAGFDLSKGILFHSGGWKKLRDRAVSNDAFKAGLGSAFGLRRTHNFYGLVEQVGAVYVECAAGFFHSPNFSDVIIRDPRTWEPVSVGEQGVVEVLSPFPLSYPGHALLTEDLAILHGIDDCPCGQLGRRFSITGRIPKVEIRGCSDTHVASHA